MPLCLCADLWIVKGGAPLTQRERERDREASLCQMCDVSQGGTLVHCAPGLIVWIKENIIKTFPHARAIRQKRGREERVERRRWWMTNACPSPLIHMAHTHAQHAFSGDDTLYISREATIDGSQMQTASISFFFFLFLRGHYEAGGQLKFWLPHESAMQQESASGNHSLCRTRSSWYVRDAFLYACRASAVPIFAVRRSNLKTIVKTSCFIHMKWGACIPLWNVHSSRTYYRILFNMDGFSSVSLLGV